MLLQGKIKPSIYIYQKISMLFPSDHLIFLLFPKIVNACQTFFFFFLRGNACQTWRRNLTDAHLWRFKYFTTLGLEVNQMIYLHLIILTLSHTIGSWTNSLGIPPMSFVVKIEPINICHLSAYIYSKSLSQCYSLQLKNGR